MSQILTLKLPFGTSPEAGKALKSEINSIAQVRAAGLQTRGLDATVIAIWINLVGPSMDVVEKIGYIIRERGLIGVEIHLPNNGGVVTVDSTSPADLEEPFNPVHLAS